MRSSDLDRQNSCVSLEKCEAEIPIKKRSTFPSMKRTQFPLMLAWLSTFHEVQGLNLEQGVIDFGLEKEKIIWARSNIYFAQ